VSGTSLTRLFVPASVAVVGASPTAGKAGNALMRSLEGFTGPVHPVHPKAEAVLGRRAYRRVADIPEPVDLALLAVPAAAVPAALADCGAAGVGGAIVHAGGFAEAGCAGAALQRASREAATAGGVRLLGPNTSGFVAPPIGLCATFVASTRDLQAGPLAIVAQSGGVCHALAFGVHGEGLGVHLAVGLGNAADVGFADVLRHLEHDPGVGVVALAIEGVADGRALTDAAERLVDRVPVVALVLGRSDVGDFARSHTGELTGSRDVTRAALRAAGAVIVEDTTELLDAARALSGRRLPATARPGVGVITGQAGPGLLLTDALTVAGMELPPLDADAAGRLHELLGDLTYQRNPVDTGRPGETFGDVVEVVAQADGVDVLAVYLLDEPDAIDVREVVHRAGAVPLVVGTAGPPAGLRALQADLAARGATVLPTPERAAAAVAALARDARRQWRRRGSAEIPIAGTPTHTPADDAIAPPWDEVRAKELVAALGIPSPRRAIADTHAEALAAAAALGDGPVALKLLHPALAHKTDAGAVRLDLTGGDALLDALDALDAVELPAPRPRYLVEAMAAPGPELLLGAVRDPSFGPVVTLAAGGVDAEIVRDAATRVAPLTVDEAATMLDDLRFAAKFRGHRGAPAVDEAALALAVARLGALLCERVDIAEVEVNPLRVTRGGLIALDALVVRQ
jgi:acyl-CoA synthetase (NDP forming)